LLLVIEYLQRQARIQLRIVASPSAELPVLIMLDEVVVGIPRECKGIQTKRINPGKLEEPQVRSRRFEMRYIEADQIVAEQKRRAPRELVQAAKCLDAVSAAVR
jgi:hypothetical protein